MFRRLTAVVFCSALMAHMPGAQAATSTLVSIKTPRGAAQQFILIKPEAPVASVILFAGGHGALGLKSASSMAWGAANFLVRTRGTFAAHNLMVAVVDVPSDQRSGMNAIFRMSGAHAADIGAVAEYLKKEKNVPVWLVGTSMGTFSAAGGVIGAKGIDGLALTSTITRSKQGWKIAGSHPDGVASMPLQKVAVPTLILSHKRDGCDITPASDAPKLRARLTRAPKVEVVLLDGGLPPQSDPCEAKSQHGFLGIEGKAVDTIAAFVKAHGK
ncbi:MAG: alpha/beta hydrolase [Bacteroidota bacterium]